MFTWNRQANAILTMPENPETQGQIVERKADKTGEIGASEGGFTERAEMPLVPLAFAFLLLIGHKEFFFWLPVSHQ